MPSCPIYTILSSCLTIEYPRLDHSRPMRVIIASMSDPRPLRTSILGGRVLTGGFELNRIFLLLPNLQDLAFEGPVSNGG